MRRLGLWTVAALAALLSGVIAIEIGWAFAGAPPVPIAAAPRTTLPGVDAPVPDGRPAPRERQAATILARPLFAKDRRAVTSNPAAIAIAETTPSAMPRLAGVLINGTQRSVIFVPTGTGKATVVHEGEQVGGFRVGPIDPGRVTLQGPDGPRVISLAYDRRAPPPPTTPLAGPNNASQLIPVLPVNREQGR